MRQDSGTPATRTQERMVLQCLRCKRELERTREHCACLGCGARWPVVGGIPRFYQEKGYYWGEIQQKEARDLLEAARKGYWLEAVQEHFADAQMVISITDLQRTAWLPLLGLERGAIALDIGSGYGAITHALAHVVEEVHSVEAVTERIEFTRTRLQQEGIGNVHLIQASAVKLPFSEQAFDLVVVNGILEWVGEWDLEGDPRAAQLKFLSAVQRLLKDDGVLVIGIENRFGYSSFLGARDHSGLPYTNLLPRRLATQCLKHISSRHHRTVLNQRKEYRTYTYSARGYRKLLAEAGFGAVSLYWADPGYNQPYHLIPLDARALIRQHFLRELEPPGPVKQTSWRHRLKRVCARIGILPWLLPEFVIMAEKTPFRETGVQQWFAEILERELPAEKDRSVCPKKISWSSSTTPFTDKHVLRFCKPQAARERMIAKAETCIPGRVVILKKEFSNLALVRERFQTVPTASICVPKPMGSLSSGNILYYMESAARGTQFSHTVLQPGYFKDAQRVKEDFGRIIRAGLEVAEVLRDLPGIDTIDPGWYEIPTGLAAVPGARGKLERMRYACDCADRSCNSWVQHGDFTVENVFLDRQAGRVEVIDWSQLSAGMPPLYDIFSLLASSGYRDPMWSNSEPLTEEEYRKNSFRDLFFSHSGLAGIAAELLVEACGRLQIPPDQIPALLVEFLIIRTNAFQSPPRPWARVHEWSLRFLLGHPEQLVFGRFPIHTKRIATKREFPMR